MSNLATNKYISCYLPHCALRTGRLLLARIQTSRQQIVNGIVLFGRHLFARHRPLGRLLRVMILLGGFFRRNLCLQSRGVVFVALQGIATLFVVYYYYYYYKVK